MLLALLFVGLMPSRPAARIEQPIQAAAARHEAEPTLNWRIRRADPKQYRGVPGEDHWKNPRLDVTNTGFWLHAQSIPDKKFVTLADLRRVLTQLPVNDWPYGRVVVVQHPGVIPADPAWESAMQVNYDTALGIVAALNADWWGWPSA